MLTSSLNQFNNLPYSNRLRQPRAIVTINGIAVLWESIQVQTTTFFIADNYDITIPLNNQPNGINLEFWSNVTNLMVKIYIGFPKNPDAFNTGDLELFMTGSVDLLEVDPLSARVMLSGRDLSSRLIDTKTTQIYTNQTASYIATQLANKHNLTPIITKTTGNIGRFFNNQTTNAQNLLAKQTTDWDLLSFIAQQSGFVAFVRNESLYFQPFPSNEQASYILQYQPPTSSNNSPKFYGTDLRFRRSLTLANDVIVHVIVPANPQTGKAFTKTAMYTRRPRGTAVPPAAVTTKQTFSFIFAGLTPEQAQQQANTLAQNITLHEIIITATLPGDNFLLKDSLLQLRGTGASFDQIYYTDLVTRTITVDGGYTMSISAKNHSTQSMITTEDAV